MVLMSQLCVALGYITCEQQMLLDETILSEYDDPANLRLLGECEELPGSNRFHALFETGDIGDKYRRLFFRNSLLNPVNPAKDAVLCALDRFLGEDADATSAALLRRVRYNIDALATVHVPLEVPANLSRNVLWSCLRRAWGNPLYWFSIAELQFIMSVRGTAGIIYMLEEEVFQPVRVWQGLVQPDSLPEDRRRIVFEPFHSHGGCTRGHFSRLLSEETWLALGVALGHSDCGGESVSRASSDDDADSCGTDTDDDAESVASSRGQAEQPAEISAPPEECVGEERPAEAVDEHRWEVEGPVSPEEKEDGSSSDESVRERMQVPDVASMVLDDDEFMCQPCLHQEQSADAQSEVLSDVLSDISDDDDMFNVSVDPHKTYVTDEDVKLERIDILAGLLRSHPLLPADPRNPTEPYLDVASGVRLPLLHCAFHGCTWTEDLTSKHEDPLLNHWGLEWRLFTHLMAAHSEAFQAEIEACGIVYPERLSRLPGECDRPPGLRMEDTQAYLFLQVISNYTQAVCVREREGVPKIGVCIDRRTLRPLNSMLHDAKALICFGCAQVFSHVPLWRKMYSPGQHGQHQSKNGSDYWNEHASANSSQNSIEMFTVGESLRRFFMRNEKQFRLHFDLRHFKERYASSRTQSENPFINSSVLNEDSYEWVQHVSFTGVDESVPLLCCPEDVQKCKHCARSQGRLSYV